jgi:hypothetical protein
MGFLFVDEIKAVKPCPDCNLHQTSEIKKGLLTVRLFGGTE